MSRLCHTFVLFLFCALQVHSLLTNRRSLQSAIGPNSSLEVPRTWPSLGSRIVNPRNPDTYLIFTQYGRGGNSEQAHALDRRIVSLTIGLLWSDERGFGFDTTVYRGSVDFRLVDHYRDRRTLNEQTIRQFLAVLWSLVRVNGLVAFECDSWLHTAGQVALKTAKISLIVRRAPLSNFDQALPFTNFASRNGTNMTLIGDTSNS